jgi:heat-inducible transcriptional repressor
MLELEGLGLLEQPHAAAGRVPSDRGYRLFVDGVSAPEAPSDDEREAIERALAASARDVEHLLGEVSRLLADLAVQVGFAVAPPLDEGELAALDLVPVGDRRVLLVLGVRSGMVRTFTLELTSPLGRSELERVARLLRERLLGRRFAEARRRLADDEALVRDAAVALVAHAAAEALEAFTRPGVFVGGAAHVARHPEFRTAERLRPVLELLDGAAPWRDLVTPAAPPGLSISIGRENGRPELAHLSLVCFRLDGPVGASIGLLGPRRMDYARAMGLVEFVGRRLSSLM